MIEIKDPFKISNPIYEQITARFDALKINPLPLNYLIWYHYFKESNPSLVDEMNELVNANTYNDRAARRLYQNYFEGANNETLDQFDSALREFVNDMVIQLQDYGNDLGQESSTLKDYTGALNNPDLTKQEFKDIAGKIIRQASDLHSSTLAMSQNFKDSAQEVDALRKELEAVRAEALTDELTACGNRKAFNQTLDSLTAIYDETPENLCLIIADIDYFKKFNDTYGHLVGDSVLRYFGRIMKQTTQENEHICRYGGEEFGIIIQNTTLSEAIARAESIRTKLQSSVLTLKDSNERISKITASFGVAEYQGKDDTIDAFIERADTCLYHAKNTGRNRVVAEDTD